MNFEFTSCSGVRINLMDAPAIITLITTALRADYWECWSLVSLIDDGIFVKWPERLKYLDEHEDYGDHFHNGKS